MVFDPIPFKIYLAKRTSLVVFLRAESVPFFDDCVASEAACTGVDIETQSNWDEIDLCLCWDILQQQHCFFNKEDLIVLTEQEGYIPFDQATSRLRGPLSLLKYAQDKLYRRAIFATTLVNRK